MTKNSENVFETKQEATDFIAQAMEEGEDNIFYTRVRCDGRIIVEIYERASK